MKHIDATMVLERATWEESQALVLTKLGENSAAIDKLRDTIQQMAVLYAGEIASLKVKSGTWGFIGGLFSVLIVAAIGIIAWLKK